MNNSIQVDSYRSVSTVECTRAPLYDNAVLNLYSVQGRTKQVRVQVSKNM